MGGNDLEQRLYLQEKANGITTDDFATWNATTAAQATTLNQQAKDSQEFKDTATQDYTANNSKLTSIQSYIDTLKKGSCRRAGGVEDVHAEHRQVGSDQPARRPERQGRCGRAPEDPGATDSRRSLSGVKNVRNAREFNTLGQAATGGLNATAASPDDFAKAINDLSNKFLDAQATNELRGGPQS